VRQCGESCLDPVPCAFCAANKQSLVHRAAKEGLSLLPDLFSDPLETQTTLSSANHYLSKAGSLQFVKSAGHRHGIAGIRCPSSCSIRTLGFSHASRDLPGQPDSELEAIQRAPSPQAIEACIQQCSSTLNSCKADAQTQHDSAVAKGLVGLLSKNAGMVGGAGTDWQNADSAKSACNDAYNSCSAACQ
jgi:hypothetical protein